MDEYKKIFESMDRNGNGEISMLQLFKMFSNLPEFRPVYGCGIKSILRALSVYINTNTENSVDSIENSFGSVEYWLIKINFEKFLELIEKSLILQSLFVSDYLPTELGMIWVEKIFPFIAKEGNSVSLAEFDQFMKKAQTIYKEILQDLEEIKHYLGMFIEWNNTAKSISNI